MSARTVTDETFDGVVLGSDLPVLVDFWATWCPPCKRLAPVIDQLAEEYAGRCEVVTVNTDEQPRVARDYQVMATPTLALFRGGEMVRAVVGAQPKRLLAKMLDEVC